MDMPQAVIKNADMAEDMQQDTVLCMAVDFTASS